jgi:hypothetical protein
MAYVPSNTKDLIDVMYFPWEEKQYHPMLRTILDHYIKHGRLESTDNGIDI